MMKIDRLALIVEALWELLKSKHGYTDEELMSYIAELDLSDGQADGAKTETGPANCPKCRRPNSRDNMFCQYCGQLIWNQPFM